jgi:hypothetical protein
MTEIIQLARARDTGSRPSTVYLAEGFMSTLPVTLITSIGKMTPRFASDHDGEVVATVRAIERVLKSAGRDLHDLAACLGAPMQINGNDKSTIWWCFHRRDLLSPRDRQFTEGLADWHKPLSPKQQKWLGDIAAKLGEAA